jgi:metal-dependent hydrolase (beta-lactamase superfamily II)
MFIGRLIVLSGRWRSPGTQRGSEIRNVLIDFGYMPGTLNNNISVLKLDPAEIDALVLSHGHYDHFGGLVGFLAANKIGSALIARLNSGKPGWADPGCLPHAHLSAFKK